MGRTVTSAIVPSPSFNEVARRRRGGSTVYIQDFTVNKDCGDSVVSAVDFTDAANSKLGMMVSCSAAAMLGTPLPASAASFGGEKFVVLKNGDCMDKAGDKNVYLHSCHGKKNQRWYWDGQRL